MSSNTEISTEESSGATSLTEMLMLAVGLLDGDTTACTPPAADAPQDDDKASSSSNQTPIEKSIDLLTKLQTQISQTGALSKNEVLDDVATSSLQLIGVEYHLGRAFLMLPTHQLGSNSNNNAGPSILRKSNITRAIDSFHAYLKKVDQLGEGRLNEATIKEYHTLLDIDDDDGNGPSTNNSKRINQSQIRDMKIQHFQRRRATSRK